VVGYSGKDTYEEYGGSWDLMCGATYNVLGHILLMEKEIEQELSTSRHLSVSGTLVLFVVIVVADDVQADTYLP